MNFNENDLRRDKTELLNLRFPKLPSTKVLLKLEFDTEDQVLLLLFLLLSQAKVKSTPSPRPKTGFRQKLGKVGRSNKEFRIMEIEYP